MTDLEMAELKRLIVVVASYYGRELKPEVVVMMAGDLEDLEYYAVKRAFDKYRREDKLMRFPMPAQIREIVCPEIQNKDLARATALRIREAIKRFGWPHPTAAQLYVGPAGWNVVQSFGGWAHLCENLGTEIQETTFLAQCRDAVESNLNLGKAGIDLDRPAIEQSTERRGLASIGEIVQSLPGNTNGTQG